MKGFLKSFAFAFSGMAAAFKTGRNFRFMFSFALLAVAVFTPIVNNTAHWCIITTLIGLTLSAEMFNSSIERICDRITKSHDTDIKFIKDTAAAAVLTLCIFDSATGCFILFSGGRFLKFLGFCLENPWYIAVLAVIVLIGALITPQKKQRNGE